MQGETEGKKRKSQKKKRKFGYYLYAIIVLVLTILNITLAALLLTHVQTIHVTGTKNSQKSEIISWLKKDPLSSNSIYAWIKFKTGSYNLPVYLKDVKLSLSAPWELKLRVTEKEIVGGLVDKGDYVYFDDEGMVLQKTTERKEHIWLVEGIEVERSKKYEVLQTDDEKVLQYFINLGKQVEKHQLHPDRIVWEEESMNLYFEQVCVNLGKSNYAEKVVQLVAVLENLEGKNGTLHLEHYNSDSKYFSFEEAIEENTEENDENIEENY